MHPPAPRPQAPEPAPAGWIGPVVLLLAMYAWSGMVGFLAGPGPYVVTSTALTVSVASVPLDVARWEIVYGLEFSDKTTLEGRNWTSQLDIGTLLQTDWARHDFPRALWITAGVFSVIGLLLAARPWPGSNAIRRWFAWMLGLFPWVYLLLSTCTGLGYAPLLYGVKALRPNDLWGDWAFLALGFLGVGILFAIVLDRLLNGTWVSLTRLAGVDADTHDPGRVADQLPGLRGSAEPEAS